MFITRKRLVASFPPQQPIHAVYYFENAPTLLRTPIVFINVFEISYYHNEDFLENNDPCSVESEIELCEFCESGFFHHSNSENKLGYEYNNNKRSWTENIQYIKENKEPPPCPETKNPTLHSSSTPY